MLQRKSEGTTSKCNIEVLAGNGILILDNVR